MPDSIAFLARRQDPAAGATEAAGLQKNVSR